MEHVRDYSIIFSKLKEDKSELVGAIEIEISGVTENVERLRQIVEELSDEQQPLTLTYTSV